MCDTVVKVGPDGVLFAKNSDRDPNEAQALHWHPASLHAKGARLQCTHLEIEQARETFAVLLSQPFWIWGAEMGANQHGVVIGNEAVFTKGKVADRGLLGMDLVRLGLERSESAKAAVAIMIRLLERYGQGGRAGHESAGFRYHSSFLVADPTTAYVLETVGREWRVERVEDGVRSLSNGLTIPGFAARHSAVVATAVAEAARRAARTACLAAEVAGPADMMTLLRDHGPARAGPDYRFVNGAMSAPCAHGGGVLAATQTTASWVSWLRPGSHAHWATGTAAPCTGIFKPVQVETPVSLGPPPTDRADPASLWWRHERLHRRVMTDHARLLSLYGPERDAIEAQWLARPPSSAEAFAQGDVLLADWSARVGAALAVDRRPWWVRRYWARRNQRAALSLGTPP